MATPKDSSLDERVQKAADARRDLIAELDGEIAKQESNLKELKRQRALLGAIPSEVVKEIVHERHYYPYNPPYISYSKTSFPDCTLTYSGSTGVRYATANAVTGNSLPLNVATSGYIQAV